MSAVMSYVPTTGVLLASVDNTTVSVSPSTNSVCVYAVWLTTTGEPYSLVWFVAVIVIGFLFIVSVAVCSGIAS